MTGILWAVLQSPLAVQPLFTEGKPHHLTLQYGVERESWAHLIGLPMTVGAIAHCYDNQVQAVAVALPSWCPCQNPHPHITVSWVPGAFPVLANAMLAQPHAREPLDYLVFTTIEWLEWGEVDRDRVCSVCKVRKLRSDNRSGVCSQCQPRLQKNARYR